MKIKNVVIVLLVAIILASCSPAAKIIPTEMVIQKTAIPMADNFSFIFTDYSCSSIPLDVLDTNSGVLVHTPLDETESITIPFQLTKTELEEVFQKMSTMDFFNFPSNFVIPDEYMVATEVPTASYQLSVTNGAIVNSVSWTTGGFKDSGYAKAEQLKELLRFIQEMIYNHPEYQQLPEPNAACL